MKPPKTDMPQGNTRLMFSRGSEWRRWDPHLHAPGTILNDQFDGNWDAYLRSIEEAQPSIAALGVTDYFCIEGYREMRRWKEKGRLPNVALLFPNVEMRLDLETDRKSAVNIHLLFSPADSNHEATIERILSDLTFDFGGQLYRCCLPDFAALGRAFDPKQREEKSAIQTGANQFKTSLSDLKNLFKQHEWLNANCLVAVAGSRNDGTSGLQGDDSFGAIRREIEAFAHIIFSATPSQREFWLGRSPAADRADIERLYRNLKPCLHGSDAHRIADVGVPALERYCWIKADPTFEGLRQAVIEPAARVFIGAEPPPLPSEAIEEVRLEGAPWFVTGSVALNLGLVSIIGARGSGKTALIEIIAAGASAFDDPLGESSFLRRASSPVDHLGDSRVDLLWADSLSSRAALNPSSRPDPADHVNPGVCYLSQQFVERLCSASGLATELRGEIERLVFEATDPTERLEASTFDDLASELLAPIHHRREELRATITDATEQLVHEDSLRARIPLLKKELDDKTGQVERSRLDLQALVPKGKEDHARRLSELQQACASAEAVLEQLNRQRRSLDELANEVEHIRQHTEPERLAGMRRRFASAGLSESEWKSFQLVFQGDIGSILRGARERVDLSIRAKREPASGSTVDTKATGVETWPLTILMAQRAEAQRAVGVDTEKQKKYEGLRQTIAGQDKALRQLRTELTNAEGADLRRRGAIEARREAYKEIFKTLVEEEEVLRNLYSPLGRNLQGAAGALAKLAFVVQRSVDLAAWVAQGEELIDLRKETRFRGHGTLRSESERKLLAFWRQGTPEEVDRALDDFRKECQDDLMKAMPNSVVPDQRRAWAQLVGAWLYGTGHVRVEYGIEYDGVAIEQLSPGTRGIVLLLLYLALDRQDSRPLLIDQPEENLDPRSVFDELVPHFREVRNRRQVIVVTHNANLVVNTDADQVIVAELLETEGDGLPDIQYTTGSLEDAWIRHAVCEILEGGERAFLERERRYRLRWDEVASEP
jgi:hypothetical protein